MGKEIYVGNLSFDADEEDLRDAFSRFGHVTRAVIIKDRDTGRSRGFGFVGMSSDEEAAEAMEAMDGEEILGRPVNVGEAKERPGRGGSRRHDEGGHRSDGFGR